MERSSTSSVPQHSFIDAAEYRAYTEAMRSNFTGEGVVVDAGCFAGSSTRALCEGISELSACSGRGRFVIAIDRFIVGDGYIAEHFVGAGVDLRAGESFLSVFMDTVSEFLPIVDVRPGELVQVGRIEAPIEVLAIDVAKSPSLNAYMLFHWFPRLIPGRSLVIQQDFYAPSQPWLAVTMGLLSEHFRQYQEKVGETSMFVLEKAIPSSALQAVIGTPWRSNAGLQALEAVLERASADARPSLELMKALILSGLGRTDEARRLLEHLLELDPQPADRKWEKWLTMALVSVHPKAFVADRLTSRLYMEDACFRLGEWRE